MKIKDSKKRPIIDRDKPLIYRYGISEGSSRKLSLGLLEAELHQGLEDVTLREIADSLAEKGKIKNGKIELRCIMFSFEEITNVQQRK